MRQSILMFTSSARKCEFLPQQVVHYFRQIAALIFMTLFGVMFSSCASLSLNKDKEIAALESSDAYVTEFPEITISQIAQNVTRDVFKPGDIADVNVYNVSALTNTYVVDRAGNIQFPLIGTVQVSGLTTTQLQQTLVDRYGANYLRDPSINVKIEAQELGRIVVDGSVNNPGVFQINEIINLSEALALAEGLDRLETNGSRIYIVRNIENTRKVKVVDMRKVRQFGAPDPQIIPSDIIFVEDSAGRIAFSEFIRAVPLLNTAVILGTR